MNNTTGSGTGTSVVTVSGTGSIGGTGFIGSAVTLGSGTTLAPGSNGVGTLTFNSTLNLGAGSKLNYEFAGFAQPNDLAVVTGVNGLTLNGGAVSLFQAGSTNPFSLNGVYNLIGYNGNILGTGTSSLSVLNPDVNKSYQFGTAGGFVTLLITPAGAASKFWNVDASGTWPTGSNWTTGVAPNGDNQAASFGGGGTAITAPRTVTVSSPQTVGVLNFNSPQAFTIAGPGPITLSAPADAATINNSGGNHSIQSSLVLTGDTLVNVLLAADTLTISGAISGSAPNFAKVGVGTTILSGNNNYTAINSIYAGTLQLSGAGKLGDPGNTLNMLGGNLVLTGTTQTFGSLALSGGDITNGSFSTGSMNYTGSGTSTISSAITGTTSLQINGTASGRLVLSGVNTFNGGILLNTGTLSVGADSALGDVANFINLSGGTVQVTGTTFQNFNAARGANIGSYNSAFDIVDATHVFTITPNGVTGGSNLIKRGLGTLRIVGTNAYISNATANIEGGKLQIPTGSSVTAGSIANQGIAIAPGNGQTAEIIVDNGAVLDAYRVIIGGNQANNAGGTGTLTVNGGTVESREWFTVGSAGAGTSTATLAGASLVNVNGNGTVQTQAEVGDFGAASGVLNIQGTSELRLHNNANLTLGVQNNGAGNGTVNQTGGKVTFFSDFQPGRADVGTIGGTGGLRMGLGTGRTGTYTYNLSGGELIVPVITGVSGTRVFNFDGGTLTPTADNANFISGTTAQIQDGGAVIKTSGVNASPVPVNVTIGQALVHDATAGAPAIDGGLTVNGGGSVTLTAANTFTGDTTVAAGTTLNVNNSLALQNSKLATFGAGTGLKFNADLPAITNRQFTIGGFANNNAFDFVASDGGQINLSVGGQAVTSTYGGQLTGTAASSLTKVGTGTFTLTNAALTYAGPITVSGGLLAINGTHNTGGNYTVATGGQLGGTGVIGRPITVNAGGFINPGAGIGSLNTTGAVTLNGTGGLRIELSGSTNDFLDSDGTLTVSPTSILDFSLLSNLTKTQYVFGSYTGAPIAFTAAPTFTPAAGTTGIVAPVGATVDYSANTLTLNVPAKTLRGNFNLDNTVNAADITAMLKALVDLNAYQTLNNLTVAELNQLGDFSGSGGVTNFDLQGMINYISGVGAGSGSLAAVPEPSTFALLGLGGVLFLARRRLRRTSKVA